MDINKISNFVMSRIISYLNNAPGKKIFVKLKRFV